MNNFRFKPVLDKNSLNMVKEIEKDEKEQDEKNRRRSLDKYKAKLKNIIINIYNDKLIMNKKKNKFNRTNTNINLKELIITVKLIKKEKPDPNIEAMINKVKNITTSIINEIAELKHY